MTTTTPDRPTNTLRASSDLELLRPSEPRADRGFGTAASPSPASGCSSSSGKRRASPGGTRTTQTKPRPSPESKPVHETHASTGG